MKVFFNWTKGVCVCVRAIDVCVYMQLMFASPYAYAHIFKGKTVRYLQRREIVAFWQLNMFKIIICTPHSPYWNRENRKECDGSFLQQLDSGLLSLNRFL